MSCNNNYIIIDKPITNNNINQNNLNILNNDHQSMKCSGFLYAFYKYSHISKASFIEKMVSFATASDSIHVAILPATECYLKKKDEQSDELEVHSISVLDKTFTAFVFEGYKEQRANTVLNHQYEFIFLPVENDLVYEEGYNFLINLKGSGYNYMGLPLTLLPKALRPVVKPQSFVNNNDSCCTPSRVFCSQVGLMLCYKCNALPMNCNIMNPSCCAPGELQGILKTKANGIDCSLDSILVLEH